MQSFSGRAQAQRPTDSNRGKGRQIKDFGAAVSTAEAKGLNCRTRSSLCPISPRLPE